MRMTVNALATPPADTEAPQTPWSTQSQMRSSSASSMFESIHDPAPLRPRIEEPNWAMLSPGLGLSGVGGTEWLARGGKMDDMAEPLFERETSECILRPGMDTRLYPPTRQPPSPPESPEQAMFPISPSIGSPIIGSPDLSGDAQAASYFQNAADLSVARQISISRQQRHFLVPIRGKDERQSVVGGGNGKVVYGHTYRRSEKAVMEAI